MSIIHEIDLQGNYIGDLVVGTPILHILTEVKAWTQETFPNSYAPPFVYKNFVQNGETKECTGGVWEGNKAPVEDYSTLNISTQASLVAQTTAKINALTDMLELELEAPEILNPKIKALKLYRVQLAALLTHANWPMGPFDWPVPPPD